MMHGQKNIKLSLSKFDWESKPAYYSCSSLYFSTRLRASYVAIALSITVTASANSHCLRMSDVSFFCLLSLPLIQLSFLFVLIDKETNILVFVIIPRNV